ncbi:MAG: hypothetical protein A2020_11545 [Lentisphaerae bacterium GWF2_45_14]|nr:MAG: hypothetical protein A2020_11545 [Lentisphaerae bacterium GWF2_45_14]
MNFIVKDSEGKEHGPLNEDSLIKWAEAGDIFAETPMRNALMAQWKTAADFSFLKEPLDRQAEEKEKAKGFFEKRADSKTRKKEGDKSTAFEYKYLPDSATLFLRLASTFFDFALLSVPALILYCSALSIFYFSDINSGVPVPEAKEPVNVETSEKEKIEIPQLASFESEANPLIEDNAMKGFVAGSRWKNTGTGDAFICVSSSDSSARWLPLNTYNNTIIACLSAFLAVALLYYGLLLGLFAQTFGMWFWGIFIVKPDLSEVFLLRAYYFTIMMFLLGVFSPILVYAASSRRAFHDLASGVMIIKIAGKPKA